MHHSVRFPRLLRRCGINWIKTARRHTKEGQSRQRRNTSRLLLPTEHLLFRLLHHRPLQGRRVVTTTIQGRPPTACTTTTPLFICPRMVVVLVFLLLIHLRHLLLPSGTCVLPTILLRLTELLFSTTTCNNRETCILIITHLPPYNNLLPFKREVLS